jgi:hypothetical protein
MFVRWKKHKRSERCYYRWCNYYASEHTLYAVLVKCERVNGKPRQKIVRTLGNIGDRCLDDVLPQARFWRDVREKLRDVCDKSSDIPWQSFESIMDKIRAVVPEPSEAEYEAARERNRRILHEAFQRKLAIIAARRAKGGR